MVNHHEYFSRFLKVKICIENSLETKDVFRQILIDHYSSKKISKSEILGEGDHHIIYSAGKILLNNHDLFLALRIHKDFVYCSSKHMDITAAEIGGFVQALNQGQNVPYFVGGVKFNGKGAILTEDLSERRKYVLKKSHTITSEYRISGGIFKKKTLYFIDPMVFSGDGNSFYGDIYLKDSNLITL